ncbi:hypothetical protein ACSBOB_19270 [Mesorhizobium sp. ASY16-5R]|uniref:hypothetical protein n=1 Tax=Mesorhizobium sp. ASY16-5R TaxID=3445772 RepID=UPI003FA17C7C
MNSTSLEPTFSPTSRQRQRTEAEAVKLLDRSTDLPPLRRVKLVKRIRGARQPLREAKRVISEILIGSVDDRIDFSDVQELRVKLLRRDISLDPSQVEKLRELDRMAAKGCSKADFERVATALLLYVSALPKSCREQERDFYRSGPLSGNEPGVAA